MGEKVINSKYKLHKCKLPQSNNTIQKICYYSRHKKDIINNISGALTVMYSEQKQTCKTEFSIKTAHR